jgi:23S rRNA (uracil1939-C5)-methyltransferase
LGEVLQAGDCKQTTVLLDPPATGVSVRVSELLGSLPVQKIVYVSCDPATLARDLGVLLGAGYKLTQVTPVDMFPQTADIEAVAGLVFPF